MNNTIISAKSVRYTLSLCLLLLAFAIYYPSVGFDFAYDDLVQIQNNQLVTGEFEAIENISQVFRSATPPGNLYRPLTTLSYRINFLRDGLTPSHYHLFNVFLYAIICTLVFWIFLLLTPLTPTQPGLSQERIRLPICFLAALIFTLHPVHTEAVANVVGRAELLACALGLFSILFAVQSLRCASQKSFLIALSLGATCFSLGVLSKESALTFALLLPLALIQRKAQIDKLRFRSRLLYWICALFFCSAALLLLRYQILANDFLVNITNRIENPENSLAYFAPLERGIHALRILGDYLLLLIAPLSLSADYSFTPAQVFAQTYSATGLLSLVTLLVFVFLLFLFRRHTSVFWGSWFFIAFILTANIITPIGTIMGERLLFTPSIGAIYFLVWVVFQTSVRVPKSRFLVTLSVTGLAIIFAVLTSQRLPIWKNNQTLFHQTLLDTPQSPKANYNYAVYLRTNSDNLDLSQKYFQKTLELLPNHVLSMTALADIALERKSYARVEFWYKRILEIEPDNQNVRENLTKLLIFKQQLSLK